LWGATVVLGSGRERTRMSVAALGWGVSGVVAAWVARQRVSAGDLAYLRAFWADGFPNGAAWPVTAATRAFDHLLRVPPGIVWFLVAVGGLWVAVRRGQASGRPVLLTAVLGMGPVVATYIVAGLGWYPFADRLVLFLVPVAVVLVAQVRWAVVLAVPQLVISLFPVRHEDMRTIVRAVSAEREPGDAIYVYYGAAPAFAYYEKRGEMRGGTGVSSGVSADTGGCHRGDPARYVEELDRYRGRRLWLVVGHSVGGEDSLLTRALERTRPVVTTVTASDAFARLYAADTTSPGPVVRPLPRNDGRVVKIPGGCRTSG
jgi:hypothetical protein